MRRDVLLKERLGFDDAYWHRAGKILRLPKFTNTPQTAPAGASAS
jgi:hypothetical protein